MGFGIKVIFLSAFNMSSNLYLFPSDYANECVADIQSDGYDRLRRKRPMNYADSERQRVTVDAELAEHLAERNPAGQTLAYVLLRFAKRQYEIMPLIAFMDVKILNLQNTECGSTALMGLFWGELTNPRFVDGKPRELTPVNDILRCLFHKGFTLADLKIRNHRGESALGFLKQVAARSSKDADAVEATLASCKP